MKYAAIAFGVFVILATVYALPKTQAAMQLARSVVSSRWLYAAALARILIGVMLLAVASDSRYPVAIEALGWLIVFAGLLLVVIPRSALLKMFSWIEALPRPVFLLASPFAVAFGGFIVYSFT